MIKGTVKIREKTFEDSSTMYTDSSYPEHGFYLVKDKSGAMNDQLMYVGKTLPGATVMVLYIGDWSIMKHLFGVVESVMGVEEVTHNAGPVFMDPKGETVTGDLLLDILSVAMHGKKA